MVMKAVAQSVSSPPRTGVHLVGGSDRHTLPRLDHPATGSNSLVTGRLGTLRRAMGSCSFKHVKGKCRQQTSTSAFPITQISDWKPCALPFPFPLDPLRPAPPAS